jgi:mono/diheme cytochrome c family protein
VATSAAEFSYIQLLKEWISGYFRNIRSTAKRAPHSAQLQNLTRRKRNHEDHEAHNAGNDYCRSSFILIPNLSWAADDGGTIFKAKCAMCHGADANRQVCSQNFELGLATVGAEV